MPLGKLYIVPTPIGNLADMSERAINTLEHVDLIAAEDTRHSGQLLAHFSISTQAISLHDHNESQRTQMLLKRLQGGQSIALISDAGTPLISDPGYTLVSQCRANNVQIIALPGPCALTTALSASGLPTDQFTFKGFLPVKQKAKQEILQASANANSTHIFYESPRRVLDTVELCKNILPSDHQLVLAKEISKRFETYISGSADDLLDWLNAEPAHQKGEFVLLLYCPPKDQSKLPLEACQLMQRLAEYLPPKVAAGIASEHYQVNKKALYQYSLTMKSDN